MQPISLLAYPSHFERTLPQVSQIEFSLIEKDVVFGLRQGNEALAQLNKETNIENVEKLLADTAEAIAYQKVRFKDGRR